MRGGRAIGPSEIPMDFPGIKWSTEFFYYFNVIFRMTKMPIEWRRSKVVPLYKNKSDTQYYNTYRGIKLLSHTMKVQQKVVDEDEEACVYFKEPIQIHVRAINKRVPLSQTRWELWKETLSTFQIGLDQGLTLSLFLFVLVIDELTRHIQGELPCCMLFKDDKLLIVDTNDKVNNRWEVWSQNLEPKGFKVEHG